MSKIKENNPKTKENQENKLNWWNWTVLVLLLTIFVLVCLCVHYLWKLSDIWNAVKNLK
jgi:hypothetical protein